MKFLITGADNTAIDESDLYNFIAATHQSSWNATETSRDTPVAAAMTLSEMVVTIDVAPGSGDSRTFRVMKNGTATALTVTLSDAETSKTVTGQSISFSAGDTISMGHTSSGGIIDNATNIYWAILAESVTTDYFLLFGGSGTAASATADNFQQLQNGTGTWLTTAASAAGVMPLAGNITALSVGISGAPGSGGDAYTITVLVDEANTELAVTWTDAETGIKSDTGTVAVTAGKTVALKSSIAVSPTARQFAWSAKVEPTTPGESAIMFGTADPPATGAAEYEQLMGGGNNSWITNEANRQNTLYGCTLQAAYAKIGTAPGSGKSWTFQVRENSAALTGASVAVSDTNTTNSATFSVTPVAGRAYGWQSTPAGTPTAMTGGAHLGLKVFFDTGGGGGTAVKDIISSGFIPFAR